MHRMLAVGFALVAYILFFASFLWLIAFVGDVGIVPTTVNDAVNGTPVAQAIGFDLLLIALFGIQHSVMARPGFKAHLTRVVSPSIERSIYVLAATAVLVIMLRYWHTLGGTIWDIRGSAVTALIWAVFAVGWAVVLLSTFLINHFELFGLSQAWQHGRAREHRPPQLREPLFYRYVRHPLYLGFIIAFWATPYLTMSHLLFAAGMTAYIFIGIAHEERDLVTYFGSAYDDYRQRVGMIVPGLGRRLRREPPVVDDAARRAGRPER